MIGLLLLAAGAYIIRHAWRWALAPSTLRFAVVLDGGHPVPVPVHNVRHAERIARWAAWAHGVPCAVLILWPPDPEVGSGLSCSGVSFNPDGSVHHAATLRPRHA